MLGFFVSFLTINVPYYARDHRIHNLGNVGFGGFLHASLAPFATYVIDNCAYNGVDIRQKILEEHVDSSDSVVDLGCGTGLSTPSGGTGVDTSVEMLQVAKAYYPRKKFVHGNAETFGEEKEFDTSLLFYVLHEAPSDARFRLINNALRVASSKTIIADISPAYRPSQMMLRGEPYILSYLRSIEWEVKGSAGAFGRSVKRESYADGRVVVFIIE